MPEPLTIDIVDDILDLDHQDDWKGGVNANAHPVNIDKDEVAEAINAEIRKPGQIDMRRGSANFGDVLGTPLGLSYFYTSAISERLIAVKSDGKAYSLQFGGTWTVLAATPTLDITVARVEARFFNGSMYFSSDSTTDHVWRWDGTTWYDMGDPAGAANSPNSSITCSQVNRRFVAKDNTIYYSTALGTVYQQTTQALVLGGPAEKIKGIIPLGKNKIIVGKERSTWVLDVSASDPASWFAYSINDNVGTVHHLSMARLGNNVFALGPKGVYDIAELETGLVKMGETPISEKIQPYIDRTDFTKEIGATAYDNYYLLKVVRITGEIDILVYDWVRKAWAGYWDTWNPIFWTQGRINNAERLYFVKSTGQVLEGLYNFHDNGTYPTLSVTGRAMTHDTRDARIRNMEKETVSIQNQWVVGFGDSTFQLIDEQNNTFTVAAYSNTSSSTWGSMSWPITWGSNSFYRKQKNVPKRRSLWWQVKFTHSGGPASLKQTALSAFIHPFKVT